MDLYYYITNIDLYGSILLYSKSLLNIPIKSVLWIPAQLVVYNIPPEIPIQDLKEDLSDRRQSQLMISPNWVNQMTMAKVKQFFLIQNQRRKKISRTRYTL